MINILVVDDKEAGLKQLLWAANGTDREIYKAKSVEQALELVRSHSFDVIVTDYMFEGETTGIDILRAAKEKDLYTQVIVVTAFGTPERGIEAMTLGAFDYIERVSRGTDHLDMTRRKIELAIEFRKMKMRGNAHE
jgi:DNA-binding NtrC family response regulator